MPECPKRIFSSVCPTTDASGNDVCLSRSHLFVLLLAGAVFLLAGCEKKPVASQAHAPVEVTVMKVVAQDVPVTFEYVGQTESSQQVEIRARISGFLEKRVYNEGSPVKAGQVLFLMDKRPFEAELAAARAELSQQQAALLVAQQNLKRVKPLVAQNALSQKDLDDSTGREKSAAAAVEAAKAKVISAELNLSYCTITSPVDGLSSFAKQQDGGYINPQTSLLTYVAKLDPMRVNFSLSENELLKFRSEVTQGRLKVPARDSWPVAIVLADGSTFPARGHITFADASFDQETGTYLVRAEFANTGGVLRPGQFVRVHVLDALRTNSFVLPQRAVQQGPRGEYVWVVGEGDKAVQRPVTVGEWSGDNWVIREGLSSNDRVIVDGTLKVALAPGMQLKVKEVPPIEAGKSTQPAKQTPDKTDGAATSKPGSMDPLSLAVESAPSVRANERGEQLLSLNFSSNSAVLDDRSVQPILEVATQLRNTPTQKIALTGYAVPSETQADQLADKRVQVVRKALDEAGVPSEQIEERPSAVDRKKVGKGAVEPVGRVEVVFVSR